MAALFRTPRQQAVRARLKANNTLELSSQNGTQELVIIPSKPQATAQEKQRLTQEALTKKLLEHLIASSTALEQMKAELKTREQESKETKKLIEALRAEIEALKEE